MRQHTNIGFGVVVILTLVKLFTLVGLVMYRVEFVSANRVGYIDTFLSG